MAEDARNEQVLRVIQECLQAWADGQGLSEQAIMDAHPQLMPELGEELKKLRLIIGAVVDSPPKHPDAASGRHHETVDHLPQGTRGLHIRCPHCRNAIELLTDTPFTDITCRFCGSTFSLVDQGRETKQASALKKVGHFELLSRLGVGAHGTVWEARDTKLDRVVAVKVPRREQLEPMEVEQFLREARATAQLNHSNIVRVHEVGRDGDKVYIVSDLVRGVSLSDRLTGQPFTTRESAVLCENVALALHHAHERGVIHRDLKPQNIMIDADGEPHVMDFGLAKREAGEITMTLDGRVLGTPAYMSPEQAEGKAHQADRRTDVYALGVILFELLTGERPFRGNVRMLLHQVIHDDPPSPRQLNSNVPRDLETICLKCMEKDVSRRYSTALGVASELGRYLRQKPINARPITGAARTWRWCCRNPGIAALSASLVASLVIGFFAVLFQWIRAEANGERARTAAANEKTSRVRAEREERRATAARDKESEARVEAEQRRKQAEYNARIANAHRLAAESQQSQRLYPERSVLLALEAMEIGRRAREPHEPRAEQALRAALDRLGGLPLGEGIEYYYRGLPTISPNSRWLVTSVEDGAVHVRDLTADRPWVHFSMFTGHQSELTSVAHSPDGHWLVTPGLDGTVRVWDMTSDVPHENVIVLDGHNGLISGLAVSPDGGWLASAGYDTTACLWKISLDISRSKRIVLSGHEGSLTGLRFSHDSRSLITFSLDRTARVWDLAADDPELASLVLRGHEAPITCADVSRNNRWLVTGSQDKTARLWDLHSGPLTLRCQVLKGHEQMLRCCRFSPDSRWLLTGSPVDRTARLWNLMADDPAKPSHIAADFGVVHRHYDVAFSPDSRWVTTVSTDDAVRLIDLRNGVVTRELLGHEGDITSVAFSSEGRWLATGSSDKTVRLWDLTDGELPTRSIVLRGHDNMILATAFSPDSRWLVTVCGNKTGRLWDLTSSTLGAEHLGVHFRNEEDEPGAPVILNVTRDNRWLVTAWQRLASPLDNKLRLWDLHSPGRPLLIQADPRTISMNSISENGQWLMAAGENGSVRVLDLTLDDPSEQTIHLRGHTGPVTSSAFSPDSRWLATGGQDSIVSVWDLSIPEPSSRRNLLRAHDRPITSLAFSSDSQRLAIGSEDHSVRIWDFTVSNRSDSVVDLGRHTGAVRSVAFGPSGRWLVTASDDNSVRLWNLGVPEGPDSVTVLEDEWLGGLMTFSPDGRFLASSQGVWDLRAESWGQQMALENSQVSTLSSDGRWIASPKGELYDLSGRNPTEIAIRLQGFGAFDLLLPLKISPDGRWMVTTSPQGKPLLWDLSVEKPERAAVELPADFAGFEACTFSHDSRWLATGSDDGTLRFWNLDTEDVMIRARLAVGRELSTEEQTRCLLTMLDPLQESLDLRRYANQELSANFHNHEVNVLPLRRGAQVFGRVCFEIDDAAIQLAGADMEELPQVVGIDVDRKFSTLHVLHGTGCGNAGEVSDGTRIGFYTIRYEDGTSDSIPIVYGEDLRDWWNQDGSKSVSRGKVVWRGRNPTTGRSLRLYLTSWKNPTPEKTVSSIDYSSDLTTCAPFCLAMTITENESRE